MASKSQSNNSPVGRREYYLEKPLPSSEEAERLVLGAVLLDNSLIDEVADSLVPSDFYSPFNRVIYSAMLTLHKGLQIIDPVLIANELQKDGSLEQIGGIAAISNLVFGLPGFSTIAPHVTLVKEKSMLRELIRSCNSIVSDALEEERDYETIIQTAEAKLHAIAQHGSQSDFAEAFEAVADSIDTSRQRAESGATVLGVPTGFIDLDSKLKGLQRSDMIVLAARPNVGKTTLALNIAQHVGFREQKMVAIFSLEMSKEQIAEKLIVSEAGVDGERFQLGHLSAEEWGSVETAQIGLPSGTLFINDSPLINPAAIRSKLRRLEKQSGKKTGLIVLDYLQLMGDDSASSRHVEVAMISRSMKLIAKEFDCPALVLSQLNRAPESRANHRPNLSDLRESGAIEQDADVVMFIFREDQYMPDPQYHTNKAEIIIAKNRRGPSGVAHLYFDAAKSTFRTLAHEHQTAQAPAQQSVGEF